MAIKVDMKLRNIMKKRINTVFTILFIISFVFACSKINKNQEAIDENKATSLTSENNIKKIVNDGVIAKEFKEPIVVKDEKMPSGLKTTWQCVYFGSFPQVEVLRVNDELPIDEYALNDDVIRDNDLYEKLEAADFEKFSKFDGSKDETRTNSNPNALTIHLEPRRIIDVELDGEKYRVEGYNEYKRYNEYKDIYEKADDDTKKIIEESHFPKFSNKKQYYKRNLNNSLRFFKYTPIKWRVIHVENNIVTLMADKLLISMEPNTSPAKTHWANSIVRYYLNAMTNGKYDAYNVSGFYNVAFDENEKSGIVKTKVENKPNMFYGTSSGEDTEDYVFIPSNDEIFSSAEASEYGFYYGSGVDDASKRFRSTIYAKYTGAWWSPAESYKGNSFWMMRTNGYSDNTVSYICDFGYIYNRGMVVNMEGAGVLPMMRVDVSKVDLIDAGTVSSDEINKDTYKFKNVNDEKSNVSGSNKNSAGKNENIKRDYEIVTFGTYPQREIINNKMYNSKDFNLKEEDYILDEVLYNKLDDILEKKIEIMKLQEKWDFLLDVDGEKYYYEGHPIGLAFGDDPNYIYPSYDTRYNYKKDYKRQEIYGDDYHFFKMEPIKWRVLENANGKKTLISDKVLDCRQFYLSLGECTWEESYIIKWLNADGDNDSSFYKKAFSEEEKERILVKKFNKDNMKNNYYFGTSCMAEEDSKKKYTGDVKVYLLSEEELFYGEKARIYGFNESDGVSDVNRRFKSTGYAKFKGVWFSNKDDDKFGNSFYMTRTNGYDRSTVVYVGEDGSIFNRGISFNVDDMGFLPVIEIE